MVWVDTGWWRVNNSVAEPPESMIGCAQSPRVHGCRNGRHAGDVDGHSPRNQYGHRVAQLRAHTLGHEHGLYRVPHTRERAYTHLDSVCHLESVLVVVSMHMMEVTVVQVVDVVSMPNRRMTAAWAMDMRMVSVRFTWILSVTHDDSFFLLIRINVRVLRYGRTRSSVGLRCAHPTSCSKYVCLASPA